MARYCNIDDAWAESICFQVLTAREVIERLVVNDGQPARGHRKNLFNPELKNCGIACGPHETLDNIV